MPPMLRLYYCCSPVGLKKRVYKVRISQKLLDGSTKPYVVSYPKGMQHHTLKSIQDAKGSPVGRKEDEFAVVAELDSRPLAGPVILKLEGGKGTLLTSQSHRVTFSHTSNLYLCRILHHITTDMHDSKKAVFNGQQLELILEILKYLSLKHPSYLVKRPQIIKFNHFWIDSSSKN